MCGGSGIGEIEGKATGDEAGLGVCRSHGGPRRDMVRRNRFYVPHWL
jgi:hypothetical protein